MHLYFYDHFTVFSRDIACRPASLHFYVTICRCFLMISVVMNPHMPVISKLCFLMNFSRHASSSISISALAQHIFAT